ncbi:MAG: NAD-dependent epimerase/dehydratase family protein [Chloroflexi bacterium]|nr:NAD-dependent epimerase/dehydratase family protein [Chloroflexota bacterium]
MALSSKLWKPYARRSAIKIAVTGGSGFIASHVVDQLLEVGHDVTVIDVLPPRTKKINFREADLRDTKGMIEATKGMEVVYHLAAVANVNHAQKDPLLCVDLNMKGTANVLEAARQNGVSRVLFASTVWVYNATLDEVATEESCLRLDKAGHLYTSSKIAGEMLLHSYWQMYQLPFTILRYGIPYGPRMRDDLVIPIFFRKALAGEPLTINGDGKQYRKFVYVKDLAAGNVAALSLKAKNQTYNLEGTESVSILDIAQGVKELVGGVELQFTPARTADFKGCDIRADKAKKELGWIARTPFAEGLRKSYEWYLEAHPSARPAAVAG